MTTLTEALGTDPYLGLDLTADLDEDWAVPCQHSRHVGDAPAEWIAWTTKCCGRLRKYMLLCSPCLHSSLGRMRTYDRFCPHCGHHFAPASTVVRLIEPLNRRQV